MTYVEENLDVGGTVTANVTWILCSPGVFVTITLGDKRGCVPAEVKVFCWRGGKRGSDGCVTAKSADEFL